MIIYHLYAIFLRIATKPIRYQSVFHGISCHVRVWTKNAEISKYFPFEVGYAALNNPVFYKDGLRRNQQVDNQLAERLFDQLAFNIYIYIYILHYPKNHGTLQKKRALAGV